MNHASTPSNLVFLFSDVPGLPFTCSIFDVRDIWAQKDLGSFTGSFSAPVDIHDSAFITISCL